MNVTTHVEKEPGLKEHGIQSLDLLIPHLKLEYLLSSAEHNISRSQVVSDIAYYCHSSGTSSGVPKPIPQRHKQLLALLCCDTNFADAKTFTTTPLYHGGLPDCLRAWACGAMVWIFPEGLEPLTPATIGAAYKYSESISGGIEYFSCVPFVLEMLVESDESIEMLHKMKLVGVGGAALGLQTGDTLVSRGVKLISRMGSAECGFLMSSIRDFERDSAWNYLRWNSSSDLLTFQPREDGLSELVVAASWPGLNVSNTDDGAFATSDLFEPHERIQNAWKCHSRADSQIALDNGKKFDPEPIENQVRTCCPSLVRDVLIFGNGRPYAGMIVFGSSSVTSEADLVEKVWQELRARKAFEKNPRHASFTKTALTAVLTDDGEEPLEKSSKGTILRNKAESRYSELIESFYSAQPGPQTSCGSTLEEMEDVVAKLVAESVNSEHRIGPVEDLFSRGVDSITALHIRSQLQSICLREDGPKLPRSVLYDYGTIRSLAKLLYQLRNSGASSVIEEEQIHRQMKELAQMEAQYEPGAHPPGGKLVVLTGATGFLGSHILDQVLLRLKADDPSVSEVLCLVRGSHPQERVLETLRKYKLDQPESSSVTCLTCDFAKAGLGLTPEDLAHIRQNAFIFIHSAWNVNFARPVMSFKNDIIGLQNLIKLSTQASAHFAFVSSVASVDRISTGNSTAIPEVVSHEPTDSSALGYAQSKWAAEQQCVKAWNQRKEASTCGFPPLSIIRVGQLCGNHHGVWNMSEAYPLMLSTTYLTGVLPDFPNKTIDWLPVEVAAQAITQIAIRNTRTKLDHLPAEPPCYHVLNRHRHPRWSNLTELIKLQDGSLEILSPREWLERLVSSIPPQHKATTLVPLWEKEVAAKGESAVDFDSSRALEASQELKNLEPLGEGRLLAIWKWVVEESRGDA